MRKTGPDVAFSGSPSTRNRGRREIGHLDGKLGGADLSSVLVQRGLA
jgi:hypothetical protein